MGNKHHNDNKGLGGRYGNQMDELNKELAKSPLEKTRLGTTPMRFCMSCRKRKPVKGGQMKTDPYGNRYLTCSECVEEEHE